MADSIEDLNLPSAVVQRLIKEALPKEASKLVISKEIKIAAQRATSLFILHLTTEAMSMASEENRKIVNEMDVLNALKEIGFEHFAEALEKDLPKIQNAKKGSKKGDTSKNASTLEDTMDVDGSEIEEEEDDVDEAGGEGVEEEEEAEEEPDK